MNNHTDNTSVLLPKSNKFGRYRIIKLLGKGAMGRVYLAEDPVLQRLVALKVIALDREVDDETRADFFKRFDIEARSCATLNHPSIVAIHDAGEDSGIPWIAFELVKGRPLDQLLRVEKCFSFKKTKTITTQIASALEYAHAMHIIHRDIKPENILIDEHTHAVKLADFGVAKAPWSDVTRSGKSVGSPGYMSPEQIEGTRIDARSDLFSLGIVMYEMLTGKNPFLKKNVLATFSATCKGVYVPILDLRPDTPSDLVVIINLLLQIEKKNRIRSAAELHSLISPGTNIQFSESSSRTLNKSTKIDTLFCQKFSQSQSVTKSNNVNATSNFVQKTTSATSNPTSSHVSAFRKFYDKAIDVASKKSQSYFPTVALLFHKLKKTL